MSTKGSCLALLLLVVIAFCSTSDAEDATKTASPKVRITWDGPGQIVFSPKQGGTPVVELVCSGRVSIESDGVRARADRLRYDAQEDTLLLESEDTVDAEIEWWGKGEGIDAKLTARRILFRLAERRFVIEGANAIVRSLRPNVPATYPPPNANGIE